MKDTLNLIDQLIILLEQLKQFRSITELTEVMERSDRNVYRYIKALEEIGFVFTRKITKRNVRYKIESIPREFSEKIDMLALMTSQS